MAGTYCEVTLADIEDFLAECKRPPTRVSTRPHEERWYEWLLPELAGKPGPQLTVRWYTSVVRQNGDVSRGAGKDAMRVVVVRAPNTARERIVLSMTRVHRIPGWEERILSRMTQAWRLVTRGPRCPACGAYMAPKASRKRILFWSCTRFGIRPKGCNGSLAIRQTPRPEKVEEVTV